MAGNYYSAPGTLVPDGNGNDLTLKPGGSVDTSGAGNATGNTVLGPDLTLNGQNASAHLAAPTDLTLGGANAPAHLAGPTPEADLLSHLQTAPLNAPVFSDGHAVPAGPAADPLASHALDAGAAAPVDLTSQILDHGVDLVQLLGAHADPSQDASMQALIDHLQHPHA